MMKICCQRHFVPTSFGAFKLFHQGEAWTLYTYIVYGPRDKPVFDHFFLPQHDFPIYEMFQLMRT